jgi:hypothetical protein
MRAAAIVLMSMGAAVAYGVVHDQITVRISPEYFTIGHPRFFETESLTALALFWGVVATWWVGAILGVLLAVAARAGMRPKRDAPSLARPLAILMLIAAVCALVSGLVGHFLARAGLVYLLPPLEQQVPIGRHVAYLTALWAHLGSYGAATLGGGVLIWRIWRGR